MNVLMPWRRAASAFSRMPPTGSTRPLSVISPVIATSSGSAGSCSADTIAVAIVTPAEGPSFGIAPAGTWMWRSCVVEEVGGDAELLGRRADVADRRARRFLHHVAELAGENDVAVARRQQARFDEQDVAAALGPGDAGRDAGTRDAERDLVVNLRRSEIVGDGRGGHDVVRRGRRRRSSMPATRAAILRATAPICRSRLRTPASRVYSRDDLPHRVVLDRHLVRRRGRAPRAGAESGTAARCGPSPPRCSRPAR